MCSENFSSLFIKTFHFMYGFRFLTKHGRLLFISHSRENVNLRKRLFKNSKRNCKIAKLDTGWSGKERNIAVEKKTQSLRIVKKIASKSSISNKKKWLEKISKA